ncbi:sulfite exporter TauE/SafE family protein [Lentibacillus halophilus]|uniref:Probable membrane transporter protein n=1 Tax=Lentibacillus halophilus TaxID=295065 RepID=A0ABN0Z221_9BACI
MIYVISTIIAFAAAFIGSLVGMGGGVILIPSLLFLHQYSDMFSWATPQVIVGLSLISMVFTAFSSTLSYYKNDRIHVKIGLLFLTGSIPGSVLGAWLNQFVNADYFSLYFGFLMIALSFVFLIKKKQQTNAEPLRTNNPIVSVFFISLIVGIISGLFGIGGGSIIVPAMIFLFGLSIHTAAATSMFIILFISIISAITHIVLGHVAWAYVLLFVLGAWIGGTTGAKVNQLINSNILEWILRLLLIVVGIRLIIEGMM